MTGLKKVTEFISMVNKDNDPRLNSRAYYFLTDKGEIENNIIYVEFSGLMENGKEIKFKELITVEQIELALVDKTLIFNEMVNKCFYLMKQKYGDITVCRCNN